MWLCGIAALGVHVGWGEKRNGSFLLLHLKWEGGLQWAHFRCEEQKARFSPYTIALPFSQYPLDDQVSIWSPSELHFNSLYSLVRFIFQTYKARHSFLCIKQLNRQCCQSVVGQHLEVSLFPTSESGYISITKMLHVRPKLKSLKNNNLWPINIIIA